MIISAIGSAWIAPLATTQQYHSTLHSELREQVKEIQSELNALNANTAARSKVNEYQHTAFYDALKAITEDGSPVMRERTAVIEFQLKQLAESQK